ncbi:MAG: ABC transporter substrate-binding protein [Lachnospirales bacterium]
MKKIVKSATSIMLASAMFLTSCGGSSDTSSSEGADTGSESSDAEEVVEVQYDQGVTDDTVKVGNSIAVSGALAPVGVPFKAGIEAYFKMINDGGGIDGRQIEYVHQDDEFSPEKGKAALEKLVHDEEVFAIVGHFGTPVVGATLSDINEIGIPTVYFATGTGILYNENATEGDGLSTFPVQPVYPMEGRILSTWAKGKFEGESVGVIYTNDDAGKDLLSGIEKEAADLGLEVVAEQVQVGDVDVSAAVTKINDADVDVVLVAAIQNTFPQVVKELAKQGNDAPVITTYVNADPTMTESVATDVGDKFEVYADTWVDVTQEDSLATFGEWVSQVSSEDFTSNSYAMTGWIAAHFFCEGLDRLDDQDITWENYIAALESEPVKNPFGGYIDFANGARLGTSEMGLVKMDPTSPLGWADEEAIQSMSDMLGE